MFNLADVLQFIVNSLYDRPFPEEYFVMEIHQRVLHVPFQLCHQVYIIDEEHFEEVLADIPPVGEELPEESFFEHPVLQRFPVVHIGSRETERDDLSPVVADEVKLESVTPSHRPLVEGRASWVMPMIRRTSRPSSPISWRLRKKFFNRQLLSRKLFYLCRRKRMRTDDGINIQ